MSDNYEAMLNTLLKVESIHRDHPQGVAVGRRLATQFEATEVFYQLGGITFMELMLRSFEAGLAWAFADPEGARHLLAMLEATETPAVMDMRAKMLLDLTDIDRRTAP